MFWSNNFAYAVGLLTTDGSLSIDGRHLDLTSKDREQIVNFINILNLTNKIGTKTSGSTLDRKYYRVQFGNVKLYRFLCTVGLSPRKTHTIGSLAIPKKYFFDFLRGHFDGDGSFYYYYDKRWKSSFLVYLSFVSASKSHLEWLMRMISSVGVTGGFITKGKGAYQLRYAKKDSKKIIGKMFYNNKVTCLGRKRDKINRAYRIMNMSLI
jgi:hypothetical protein